MLPRGSDMPPFRMKAARSWPGVPAASEWRWGGRFRRAARARSQSATMPMTIATATKMVKIVPVLTARDIG